MKKILLILFLAIPFLGFAQSKLVGQIEIDENMLLAKGEPVDMSKNEISFSIRTPPLLPVYICCSVTLPEEEYEAIVFDPRYETFLATQPSINFFSESQLKAKNALAVNEWNYRHKNPLRYNPNIYEVHIDYDAQTDYGLEVEYRLYMFFRFMEKESSVLIVI